MGSDVTLNDPGAMSFTAFRGIHNYSVKFKALGPMCNSISWRFCSQRGDEAAELPFKKLGELNRRAIFEIRSDDLHPNGQTGGRPVDRGGGRR